MTRERPTTQLRTVWRANGRWFLREVDAYYSIAKVMLVTRYPRWLDDFDLDDRAASTADGELAVMCVGDFHAREYRIDDWRARRRRRAALLHTVVPPSYEEPGGTFFDERKWQTVVRRLAKFLMFVDRRRAELAAQNGDSDV